ncbi:DUF2637 domain-containing protein [Nonomuraea gerenzanensis]|uniref:Very large tegument protein n=1 Tax=Nonomuraea gerenzanensis TaxID=93944 RepID=A0A1M4EMN0_9ACTN|nr:DUF2637 domain-containing protein [Nonomuraea gerenzanensis]UBU11580.1 DUF2637 domain-containing protein [Nonomuraea gerenzanensis]SBP00075.1 very large tegument protein [Nonomuraea gerenzanensis]
MENTSTPVVRSAKQAARWPRIGRFLQAPFRTRRHHPVPPAEARVETGTPGRGDKAIRSFAVVVLLGVAGAAAYVSYHHFYALAIALGERHDMAILYPAMSDGVIVMASLVMVHCSIRRLPVPVLAWIALIGGGVVTLVANVAHGWNGGLGSRLLSALAPIAFVGAYELLMWLVRSGRKVADRAAATPSELHVCEPVEVVREVEKVVTTLPVDRFEAARLTFEESLKPGNKRVGRRALMNRWGIEQREAEEIIAEVERERAGTGTAPALPVPPTGLSVPSVNGSPATGTAVAP